MSTDTQTIRYHVERCFTRQNVEFCRELSSQHQEAVGKLISTHMTRRSRISLKPIG